MAMCLHLNEQDKRLLARLRQGFWTTDELPWVLDHLDEQSPMLVVQEIHAKFVELRERQANHR
jgi:hypothetical protein